VNERDSATKGTEHASTFITLRRRIVLAAADGRVTSVANDQARRSFGNAASQRKTQESIFCAAPERTRGATSQRPLRSSRQLRMIDHGKHEYSRMRIAARRVGIRVGTR